MIAILPAAGRGTRMRAVAEGPKELLLVGGKPVLQRVIDEAREAGIEEITVIVSPAKPELQLFASEASLVTQDHAEGLAPAIVLVAGIRPALVLLPDTIFYPSSPTTRLVKALSRGFDFAVAVERVGDQDVSRYGIVEWNPESGRISRILEKPTPDQTSSRWAIAARFGLSTRTLFFLKQRVEEMRGQSGEIDLTPILNEALAAGHAGLAVPLEANERRLDCGNPEGYGRACEVVDAGL